MGTWCTPPRPRTFVATNGSDSNNGSESSPFRTFNKALALLAPGDALTIRGGSYPDIYVGDPLTRIPAGTSWSNVVTIRAYPGEQVTVTGIGVGSPSAQYLVFDGINVNGKGTQYETIWVGSGAHHIRFQNLDVKGGQHFGIVLAVSSGGFNQLINLDVHHNGTAQHQDHGIYVCSPSNLVENSRIYSNAAYGIHVYPGAPNDNIIRNNYIYDNGVLGGTSAGLTLAGDRNMAYNNVIFRNAIGIQIAYDSPVDTGIYNNTVYSNRDAGIFVQQGDRAVIMNNILYQNNPDVQNAGVNTTLSNNLTSDPHFANAPSDLSLRSDSQAIDAGASVGLVATDVNGVRTAAGRRLRYGRLRIRRKRRRAARPQESSGHTVSVTKPVLDVGGHQVALLPAGRRQLIVELLEPHRDALDR